MAAEHQPHLLSVDEYFELEKNEAGICYEYVDGYVYMMAGGTFNHDTIKSNIQGILWNALLNHSKYNVYSSDIKTQVAENRYYHPDVVISCDPRDQGTGDLLKYPRVIFEVLSPSTEMKDRRRKMRDYLALSSLEEYILVDSRTCEVEMYRRESGKWVYYAFGSEDDLELAGIGLHFPVSDIYRKIHFEREDMDDDERNFL